MPIRNIGVFIFFLKINFDYSLLIAMCSYFQKMNGIDRLVQDACLEHVSN